MQFKCPQCNRLGKKFTPTGMELKVFSKKEVEDGIALKSGPCAICRAEKAWSENK